VYLQGLLSSGRLRVAEDGAAAAGSVTFHDSCYMARYNGVVAAPRDVLGAVPGLELREMEKSGKNTFCCGAGGGRMWMEETRGTRINAERTRQALETGAETVATSCPFCMVMMKDGLADAAASGGAASAGGPGGAGAGVVSARDIAEILADVIEPDPIPAGRRLPVLQ
jgi:Fe-S oxidoreductase